MKKLLLLMTFLVPVSCSHKSKMREVRSIASLQENNGFEGIWYLQGSNTTYGPYTGELELRRASNGTYQAVRIVNYIKFYYEGLRVQEVWTGAALPNPVNNTLHVSYHLNGKITINEVFQVGSKNSYEASFDDAYDAKYNEWITTKRPLEAQPLWADQRSRDEEKNLILDPSDPDFYKENGAVLRVTNQPTHVDYLKMSYHQRQDVINRRLGQ